MRFYNKRGTAEQWIKEGKQAVKMTRLSCHRFHSNWCGWIAYNLGNLCRRLALPARVDSWSLTSLQQRLKTGLELPVLQPPGAGASSNQDSKWKFRTTGDRRR